MTELLDPATWSKTGWCWRCGPTGRPIAPARLVELECCAEHLPRWARRLVEARRREVAG